MSSSTWRVLSGYATYQRTPMRMTSGGKWAPLKLIAIVALPHDARWLREEDDTSKRLKEKLRQNPCGLVVETDAHERHWMDHAESMVQTPPEQLPVAGWQEKTGTWERRCRPDEGFQRFVRLADGMAK